MSVPSCCLISHSLQQGVGPADANRLLAAEMARRGWRVSLCGLNDSSIPTVRTEEMNICETSLPALQIPQVMGWDDRCEALRVFLEQQQSEWVIFRFIPYSLNPKGIVWRASISLPKVLLGTKVLWLVDEIWLGGGSASLKHRLVGALQRYCILRLLKGVGAKRVYTNNRFNTKLLRQREVDAETMRLFGNIRVSAPDWGEWLFREFGKSGVPITSENRGQWLVLGNFGVFHSDWEPTAFFSQLRDRAKQHGKKVCIVGIGSLGSYKDHWQKVAEAWSGDFRFLHLGLRDETEISHFLQSVDFGLTTNPYYLVGKSGTCMAMLDHALPIIVPKISTDDDPAEFPAHLVLRCGERIGDEIFAPKEARTPCPRLPQAVDELIAVMSDRR